MALHWKVSPLAALAGWPKDRPVLLLHSGRADARWARYSILAEPAAFYRYVNEHPDQVDTAGHPTGRSIWTVSPGAPLSPQFDPPPWTHRPFHDLRRLLDVSHRVQPAGLWIGYLSYDLGRWVERLPARAAADRHWPIIELAWCPGGAVHATATGLWTAFGDWMTCAVPQLAQEVPGRDLTRIDEPRSVFTTDGYEAAVARCMDYIAAGDVFQVNLSQRLTASMQGRLPQAGRSLFNRLATASPAWYGAYLELPACAGHPSGQRAIASTSPELFLQVDAQRRVTSRPIKGTRPACVDAAELRDSVKDTAELNMIVDLVRNDLGRVCDYGSIRVPEPRVVETHPTIHHGVATITGRLHPSRDLVDLLRAAFPPGSVTGAPKVRAMQIIDELEPVRRGPYCGVIGWLRGQQCCLNVAIRTLMIENPPDDSDDRGAIGRVDMHVGGGVVADSQPAAERQETLDKAAAMRVGLGLPAAPAANP